MDITAEGRSEPVPAVLGRGAHLAPDDGTCLMEAVSVAARLPWSDAPPCTHPVVAQLARLVNDATTDAGRQHLAALVPALARSRVEPGQQVMVAARVAVACTEQALRWAPSTLLTHLHWVACLALEHELARQAISPDGSSPREGWHRWSQRLFIGGPAARAVEVSVAWSRKLPAAERDEALAGLLRRAVETASAGADADAAVRLPPMTGRS